MRAISNESKRGDTGELKASKWFSMHLGEGRAQKKTPGWTGDSWVHSLFVSLVPYLILVQ